MLQAVAAGTVLTFADKLLPDGLNQLLSYSSINSATCSVSSPYVAASALLRELTGESSSLDLLSGLTGKRSVLCCLVAGASGPSSACCVATLRASDVSVGMVLVGLTMRLSQEGGALLVLGGCRWSIR